MESSTIAISVFVAWFALFLLVIPVLQRRQVRKHVTRKGGTVLEIRWKPFLSWVHERNTKRWDVTYTCSCGQALKGVLQTSLFTGVKWVEGPRPQEVASLQEGPVHSHA